MVTDITAYEMAQRKLKELMREMARFRQQRAQMDAEEKQLLELIGSWHRILESEKPALDPVAVPALVEGFMDGWVRDPETDIYGIAPQPTRSYGDKTDTLREVLEGAGKSGLLPKEAKGELIAKGVKVSKSFANNALFRLKKDGQVIVLADGRYALAKFYEALQDQHPTPP